MPSGLPHDVEARVSAWCEARGIELCYLYGSRARGSARPDSDYDLAVRFSAPVSADERDALLADLQESVARVLGLPESRVDVHDLDEMPLALQYRVLRDGVRMRESPPGAHARFHVRVLGEYLDYRCYEEMHLGRMRERVREGRFCA